jgi:hypothetical protein
MADADQFMTPATQDERTATESTTRERAGAGTSSRSQKDASNATYIHESDKCNDRRTGIKATNGHASWLEVAARCHVQPGR